MNGGSFRGQKMAAAAESEEGGRGGQAGVWGPGSGVSGCSFVIIGEREPGSRSERKTPCS